ncbi:MAG: trypsin-like peptidase domain-containing protein [Planctomycetota bacterium]
MMKRLVMVGLVLSLTAASSSQADPPEERRTALVQLIERCGPAAVDLIGYAPIPEHPGSFMLSWGSGSIIHESGYILTNDHVANTEGQQVVVIADGRQFPYTVEARSPQEDLAIIRIRSERPLPALTLGQSHDLMLGEPVLVIGNPGGLTHSISRGVITGLDRVGGGGTTVLTGMIQTDATVNGGNSGGPMINALGHLIGIIESKRTDADGLGFAIQIDRFRSILPDMLSAEVRYGFRLGLKVNPMGPAVITAVAPQSPAAVAGIEVGDAITQVGEMPVSDGVHFYLSLIDREGGEVVPITLQREGEAITVEVTLEPMLPRRAEDVDVESLTPGIYLEAFLGQWRSLPNFRQLEPVSWGVVPTFGLFVQGQVEDFFGLEFTGYLSVAAEGLYTFSVASDDGSQLWIGDELVIDNDGLHGIRDVTGLIRLAAGLHPIRVTFFEHDGGQALEVFYEGPELSRRLIPETALFCHPPAQPPALQPSPPTTAPAE